MTSLPRAERFPAGIAPKVAQVPARKATKRRADEADQSHRRVKWIVRYAFYGFILSLLFEYPDRTLPMEYPTLAGFIYLALTPFDLKSCYRRPPTELWLYIAYLGIMAFMCASVTHTDDALKYLTLIAQITLLMWTGYNLMKHERIAKTGLLMLVISTSIISYMQVMRISVVKFYDFSGARISVWGQNPNNLGNNITLGLLALVGLTFAQNKTLGKWRYLLLPLAAMMMWAVIDTGSRGAPVAFGAGFLALALRSGSFWARIRSIIIVLIGIVLGIAAISSSGSMMARYMKSMDENNMSGREEIFPAAWQMFQESPLLGWGPIDNMYELGKRVPVNEHGGAKKGERDTHNMYLEVLTAFGIVGSLPLFIFIILCWAAAWRARKKPAGVLPLAFVIAIFLINMSGNWNASKLDWLLMSYALASASPFVAKSLRKAPAGNTLR